MGARPWIYFVPYRPDIQSVLDELKARELKAGRYHPVIPFLKFPITAETVSPGGKFVTVREARDAAGEDGTRSILDIDKVGKTAGYGVVAPLSPTELLEHYGSTFPTRAQLDADMAFLENIDRGKGVYVVIYDNRKPTEICFAGYSYD